MKRTPNHYKKDGDRIELLYNVDGQLVAPSVGGVFAVLYVVQIAVSPQSEGLGIWLYQGFLLALVAGLTVLLSWQACRKIVITPETVHWYRGSCPREDIRVIFRFDYHSRNLPAVLGMVGCTEEELTQLGRTLAAENRQRTCCDGKTFQLLRASGRITREVERSLPYLTERLGGERVPYPLFYFEFSEEREKLLREEFSEAEFVRLPCI